MRFNSFNKIFSLLLAVFLLASLTPVATFAEGNIYYVSPDGLDSAGGTTENTPWKTLTYAVSQMQSGDTCIFLPGTYRETLKVTGKDNLTFRAKEAGTATITGGDLVTGWTKDSMNNVWVAGVSAGVYDNGAGNIVFQSGVLCQEARWPDLAGPAASGAHPLLNLDSYARVDSSSSAQSTPFIQDSDLSELSGLNLEGAYVWTVSGVAYWSYVVEILSHDASSNTLTLEQGFPASTSYWPTNNGGFPKNIYYITGHKGLLSTEGEWYHDKDTNSLYMYHAGNSSPENVEFRTRENAIYVDYAENVVIDGIDVRSGLVVLRDHANDCTLSNMKMETLDYKLPRDVESPDNGDYRCQARGVIVEGNRNTVTGCEIFNLYGPGVTLSGNYHRVLNNYIHDYNFQANYSDAVNASGSYHLIYHNTMAHSGRSAIGGSFKSSVIAYNDMSDGGRLTHDGGLVYLVYNDFENTEFHHNVLRDCVDGEERQYGLYLDSLATGLIVYRNLLYNLETPNNSATRTMHFNYHSLGNILFNNTIVNDAHVGGLKGDHSQTVFINNLFQDRLGPDEHWYGMNERDNFEKFSKWNHDYTLADNAFEAIDQGVKISGVTDGYVGAAPDLGAFEFGEEAWVAGHDFTNPEYANEKFKLNTVIPYRNLMKNGGFEKGSFSAGAGTFASWDSEEPLAYHTSSAWDTKGQESKDGTKSLLLSPGQSVSQTATDLQPNTDYEVGCYGMVVSAADGEKVALYAKSDSGDEKKITFEGTVMPQEIGKVIITTGNSGTITVTLMNESTSSEAYVDAVRMCEAYKAEGDVGNGSFLLKEYMVTDANDQPVYGVRKGKNHEISGTILNQGVRDGKLTISVTGYGEDGTSTDAVNSTLTVKSGEEIPFYILARAPESENSYFKLLLKDEAGYKTEYLISDGELRKQYNADEEFYTIDFSVYNKDMQYSDTVTKGELNIFEIIFTNTTETDAPVLSVLAVYENGMLNHLLNLTDEIKANKDARIWLGTEIPAEGKFEGKIFVWNNFTDVKPLLKMQLFEVE